VHNGQSSFHWSIAYDPHFRFQVIKKQQELNSAFMGFREFCFFTPFRAELKIDFAFDFDKIMNQNKAKQFQIAYSRTLQGHVDYQ